MYLIIISITNKFQLVDWLYSRRKAMIYLHFIYVKNDFLSTNPIWFVLFPFLFINNINNIIYNILGTHKRNKMW